MQLCRSETLSNLVRPAMMLMAVAVAATVLLGDGVGCTPPTQQVFEVNDPIVLGTLVEGQAGSVIITCTTDAQVQSVVADLSALGGAVAEPLARGNANGWSWTGVVTPPDAGRMTVELTASGDAGEPGTAQAEIDVAAADANRLVVDLGNAVVIDMVKLPAGTFQMGTNSTDVVSYYQLGVTEPVSNADWANAARPLHAVTFAQPFFMGKYAITQAQWQAVMGDNPSQNTSDANLPVDSVSWNDAVAFCQALSQSAGRTFRLPSEAEWEYGCKAGGGDTPYFFGAAVDLLGQYAWYVDNSGGATHAVGQKLPNAFGLYDVHGNVWEWCQDPYHATYAEAPVDGSVWSTGGNTALRVLRGGSTGQLAGACRSAWRNFFAPTDHYADFSLRVVTP